MIHVMRKDALGLYANRAREATQSDNLKGDKEGPDQTGHLYRLIWVFAVCIHSDFHITRLICYCLDRNLTSSGSGIQVVISHSSR